MSLLSWLHQKRSDWEANVVSQATQTLKNQNDLLLEAAGAIQSWQEVALVSQQATRDLAIAWEASLSEPDIDISDDLHELVGQLRDQVAQLEEQITLTK